MSSALSLYGQGQGIDSEQGKLKSRFGSVSLVGKSEIKALPIGVSPHGYLKNRPVRLFAVGEGKSPSGCQPPVPDEPFGDDFHFAGFRLPGPTGFEDAFVKLERL